MSKKTEEEISREARKELDAVKYKLHFLSDAIDSKTEFSGDGWTGLSYTLWHLADDVERALTKLQTI